ncbi:MAG: hypothetical protein ACI94Y_004144, partial [Maribacter sp.]
RKNLRGEIKKARRFVWLFLWLRSAKALVH